MDTRGVLTPERQGYTSYMANLNMKYRLQIRKLTSLMSILLGCVGGFSLADSATELPIADVHVHYSHDSVDLTPPERVIELMRSANLKFALVSSSDDMGTQLLLQQAPELIIPGLRPYRRRGELQSWFRDEDALRYVEELLVKNRYASIGEFHLNGDAADLPIPRRLVELAVEHNLILHAHSDAEAVERLLAQHDRVRVLWAHAGFESPENVAPMLRAHDRLWADLAFRGEIGSGGKLSRDWRALFEEFPDRIMLGTDSYTPERIYFIPEHANNARTWLSDLPPELAERLAWKNAHDLLMPVWQENRLNSDAQVCGESAASVTTLDGEHYRAMIETQNAIAVSQPFSAVVTVCGDGAEQVELQFDASMPAHGHGMNYTPEITRLQDGEGWSRYQVDGLVLHMPGEWQWAVALSSDDRKEVLQLDFTVD